MTIRTSPHRWAVSALLLLALAAAGCSGSQADGGGAASGDATTGGVEASEGAEAEPVELTMWLFGDAGFDDLITQYEADNPGVTIETRIAEFNAHHDALTTALASGSGGPDIAAIEVGYLSAFRARPEQFVNLNDLGAAELADDYLDWRWEQALTPDGETLIGLPTDVGGMAMAYRADLFEAAGLPSDREEVGELWGTWEEFIEVGRQYVDATGQPFTDESSQIYAAVVNQGEQKYYEDDDTVIVEDNPQVQEAWDVAVASVEAGLVANIEPFAEGWNAAMSNGDFAVLTAPAWMTAYIQNQAPDTEGDWDIAALPGGGGNWGGSHLTVPAGSEHQQEAYDFISWLLAPEQQLTVFEENGNFPSTPALYEDPAIQEFTSPFFRDAPLGPIYAESAEAITPIYEGPDEGTIRLALEAGLDRVEDDLETPEEAWRSALDEIARDVE